jgi:hypothetical protein
MSPLTIPRVEKAPPSRTGLSGYAYSLLAEGSPVPPHQSKSGTREMVPKCFDKRKAPPKRGQVYGCQLAEGGYGSSAARQCGNSEVRGLVPTQQALATRVLPQNNIRSRIKPSTSVPSLDSGSQLRKRTLQLPDVRRFERLIDFVGCPKNAISNRAPASAQSIMRDSAQVTVPGALTNVIAAVSTRPNRQNRST